MPAANHFAALSKDIGADPDRQRCPEKTSASAARHAS
jgi:hypothetical protein